MKQLKYITLKRLMSWSPCYGEHRILKLSGGRRRMTPLEIAGADNISIDDRLWVLLRPEIISERTLHILACDWASEVLPVFERRYPNDKRPRQAIATKRRWIEGKATDEELTAARDAARDAAWDAAGDAAGDASWDAAGDAARAARDAAGDAARAARAAGAAAWAAAWDARERHMKDVIAVMKSK